MGGTKKRKVESICVGSEEMGGFRNEGVGVKECVCD